MSSNTSTKVRGIKKSRVADAELDIQHTKLQDQVYWGLEGYAFYVTNHPHHHLEALPTKVR